MGTTIEAPELTTFLQEAGGVDESPEPERT